MNMIEKMYAGKAGLSIFRFKSLLVCCAAFLCVASCDNPEKKLDEVDAEVSVNVESLEFGWEGGSQTLEITANQSWTVSGPEWLKFEPSKGDGNATVTVTADPSERFDDGEKTYSITVRCGNRSAIVKVHRESKPISKDSKLYLHDYFGTEAKNGVINFDGSPFSYINAQSNAGAHMEVLEGADWVIPIVDNTKTDNFYSPYNMGFKVLPNNTREKRHAKIAIQTTPATDTPEIVEFDQQDGSVRADLLEIAEALHMDEWSPNRRWDKDTPAVNWSGIEFNDNYELTMLHFNECGIRGDFPEAICNLTTLEHLYIGYEEGLTGHIPASIGNLTKLKKLYIIEGNMDGTVPDVFGSMQDLEVIWLCSNHFSGSLPASLGNCPKLEDIFICQNEFTGTVPDEWCITDKTIRVGGNRLSGQFPDAFYGMPSFAASFWGSYYQGDEITYGYSRSMDISNAPFIPADIHPYGVEGQTIHYECYDGKGYDLGDIVKKNKYTIHIHWGITNPYGQDMMDQLKPLYEKYHDSGLEIVAVNSYDIGAVSDSETEKYLKEHGYDNWMNVCLSKGLSIYPMANPFAEVIDQYGHLVYSDLNGLEYKDVFNKIAYFDLAPFIKQLFGDYDPSYVSKDFSKDGEVLTLQKASKGKGINLVFMGDAYVDKDMDAGGHYEKMMKSAMDEFFAVEPYKTYKDRFNVYAVKVVSRNCTIGDGKSTALGAYQNHGRALTGDVDKALEYALKVPSIKSNKNLTVTVLVNNYSGGASTTAFSGYNSGVAFISTYNDIAASYGPVVRHETGGHGFAHLADEYNENYDKSPSDSEIQKNNKEYEELGWWANIDFTSDPERIRWSHMLKDDRYKSSVGIYEGGLTYGHGVWKPTEDSIMKTNVGVFNAPSREAIFKRIMTLSGEDYSFEKFAAYDVINR